MDSHGFSTSNKLSRHYWKLDGDYGGQDNKSIESRCPFIFSRANTIPVTGDWAQLGKTGVGLIDPSTWTWKLRDTASAGSPDITFQYGASGDRAVVGDWDGGIGAVVPGTATRGKSLSIHFSPTRRCHATHAFRWATATMSAPHGRGCKVRDWQKWDERQ
jgi:hypothetical protein